MENFNIIRQQPVEESLQSEFSPDLEIQSWLEEEELYDQEAQLQIEIPKPRTNMHTKTVIMMPGVGSISEEGDSSILSRMSGDQMSQIESNNASILQMSQIANNMEEPEIDGVIKPHKPAPIKRTAKRSCTTIYKNPQLAIEMNKISKNFVKRSKIKIEKAFSLNQKKQSLFTLTMGSDKYRVGMKKIKVYYFKSHYSKVVEIYQNTLAIEFIPKALKEYQNERSFDQSLYQYPNYPLAYRLESNLSEVDDDAMTFRMPIQKDDSDDGTPASNKLSAVFINQQPMAYSEDFSDHSDEDINDRINIDLESQIRFKSVYLVENPESKLGIELSIAAMVYQKEPHLIIVLVEEPTSQSYFHITINKDSTLDELFDLFIRKTNNKYPKVEHSLKLKYPCVNFGQEALNERLPISQLPIYWLIVTKRFQALKVSPRLSIQDRTSFNPRDMINRDVSASKSHRLLSEDFRLLDKSEKLPRIYGYQEYELMKQEGNNLNSVTVGIDYFDFYYSYKNERKRTFSFYKLAKRMAFYFLEDPQTAQKNYRRIPINVINQISYDKTGNSFRISYVKGQGYNKSLTFTCDQIEKNTKDNKVQIIQDAYMKLEYLVELKQRLASKLI